MNEIQDRLKIRRLCTKLSNYYWTPAHPAHYVIRLANGQTIGLGKVAAEDYGLFNLVWASCPLTSVDEHNTAVGVFKLLQLNMPVVAGQSLSDWLTQLTPLEFEAWFNQHAEEIPSLFQYYIVRALHALAQVRTVRR